MRGNPLVVVRKSTSKQKDNEKGGALLIVFLFENHLQCNEEGLFPPHRSKTNRKTTRRGKLLLVI